MVLVLFFLAGPLSAQKEENHHHGDRHVPFGSVEEYIQVLERPDREVWQKPDKVVDTLSLKKGDWVADIGAGSGYFTFRIAEKVGLDGMVFGVDILPGMVEYIEKRQKEKEVQNVQAVLGEGDDPKLKKNSLDLIFIADTYHHISDRENYLNLLQSALKEEGRLAIVDFKMEKTPMGPPMRIRISKEQTLHEITKAGFTLEEDFDFLPYQYFLVFAK